MPTALRRWLEPFRQADSPKARALRAVVWLLCLAATARTFWVLNQIAVHSIIGYDLAPYAEAFEYKPPLLFYTQAVALKLLGFEGLRYRWFYCFFPMASVLALQLSVMRRGAHVLSALGMGLLASWYFTDLSIHDNHLGDAESIGLAYYFLGLSCLLAPIPRHRRITDVVGGALMACAVLSKEPYAFTVIGTWAVCFFMSEEEGPRRERAKRYALYTGAGVLGVVVVLGILMLPNGALRGYLSLVESYRTYSDPKKSVCTVLGRFEPTTFWQDLPKHWARLREDYLNAIRLGPVLPYLASAAVTLLRRSWLSAGLSLFVFAAGFHAVTATGCYWSHYYVMALAGIFCVAALGLVAAPSTLPRGFGLWMGVVLLTVAVGSVWPRYDAEAKKTYSHQPLNVPAHVLAFVRTHSAPGDRIWTTGAPGIYVFADRLSATRESAILDDYLVQYPGETDEEKLRPLREQLDRHRPKVVIVDRAYQQRKQRHFRVLIFPFLKDHGYQERERDLWVRP
jgi:hypothetical protein